MAQVKSLKELADLGFTIGWRFCGRYPDTSRSYYKPPKCESDVAGHQNDANRPLSRWNSAPSALLVHSLSANCSEWISNGNNATSGSLHNDDDSPTLRNMGFHSIVIEEVRYLRRIS